MRRIYRRRNRLQRERSEIEEWRKEESGHIWAITYKRARTAQERKFHLHIFDLSLPFVSQVLSNARLFLENLLR